MVAILTSQGAVDRIACAIIGEFIPALKHGNDEFIE